MLALSLRRGFWEGKLGAVCVMSLERQFNRDSNIIGAYGDINISNICVRASNLFWIEMDWKCQGKVPSQLPDATGKLRL